MDHVLIAALLHPVRMRIMQELTAQANCTSRHLGLVMPDVPQASLYRHLKALLKAEVLEVADETRVRGTMERQFRIKRDPFAELDAHGAALPNDRLLNLFYSFMLAQLSDCAAYLDDPDQPIEPDRFGFRTYLLDLDDEAVQQFIAEFRALLERYSGQQRQPGTRPHKFSFSLIPVRPDRNGPY